MDWSADEWQDAFGGVRALQAGLLNNRIELRVEAIGFASRGWPVLPGTYPVGTRWIGRDGGEADGPMPVHQDWEERLGTNPDQVAAWWSSRPHSLLLATGTAVNAVEVDAALGYRAAVALRTLGFPVPIVAVPNGRWYFLTSGGDRLAPELADLAEVRLHGAGSWVPMPPTTYPHGAAHWRVKPEVCGWTLPSLDFVQDALVQGLNQDHNVADLVAAGG
ncbi:bifunctional DNA primase/polymerase [Saccharopolyspora erythraea]|uniref:bifunctional DNA primase/polymerase n=1 Tax=Saccharopolyspora erythraea TaxID=1836 RepID=UPI001BA565F0|nr:bifunctional DNA primase/polymerase [Saccharopolyspora erythraea]QUG99729.1 bifunctional DNA primase/polymerase [Saccharopolyspora erythraea]